MRIKELDGLRGVAVLAVIDCHYLAWFPASGSRYGWLGVDLFFVLSGFLITSILLQLRSKEHYFKTFYARRALRILPPYLLGLLVYFVISVSLHEPGSLRVWLSYIFYYVSLFQFGATMLHGSERLPDIVCFGLGVLWSLSVEEIYYTIWAPVIRYTKDRGLLSILGAMILIAPVLRWKLHSMDGAEIFTFYCRMDGLAYGSAVALLFYYRQRLSETWRLFDRACDALALPFICFATVLWLRYDTGKGSAFVYSIGISAADICFALIVYALIRRSSGNQLWIRGLRAKWLTSIGTVSYSLYLFHYPLLIASEDMLKPLHLSRRVEAASQVLLGLAMSFAVAYGLWYGMEGRILRWKDRKVPSPAHPQGSPATSMALR